MSVLGSVLCGGPARGRDSAIVEQRRRVLGRRTKIMHKLVRIGSFIFGCNIDKVAFPS
jgi:hypothetical protein